MKPVKVSSSKSARRLAWFAAATITSLLTAGMLFSATRARHTGAQDKDSARPTAASDQSTSLSDQTDLAVTVYNSNIALVRDVRQLTLPAGDFRLKFMDIAATVNPATVHFRSLTEPEKLSVLEQNYEYDLLEPAKLLHKYVGKEVTLVRSYQENGTTKREEIKATLLSRQQRPRLERSATTSSPECTPRAIASRKSPRISSIVPRC